MKQARYNEEYAKFRQCLAVHLTKKSQLNIEDSKKVVDDAMSMYIKKEFSPNLKRIIRAKAQKNVVLNGLYEGAGFLYRLVRGRNLTHKYDFFPEYGDDFEKIKNQVIKSEI